MLNRNPFKVALIVSCWATLASACDTGESVLSSEDAITAQAEAAISDAELTFDWGAEPLPAIAGVTPAFDPPPASLAKQPFTVESFYIESDSNYLSLTSMAGGLFTPLPIGMQPLPTELDEGFMVGFTFTDENGDMVGFGSEQEVLDFVNATGETIYALTIPGRGSLLLEQEEEFAYMFEEINDMVADQEFVREFSPPLVNIHTVPGTARIIGGTGEFAHIKGFWREISIIYKLDLLTGLPYVGLVLQIAYF